MLVLLYDVSTRSPVSTKLKMLSSTPTASTSITTMPTNAFLPEEITINILKRLPVKSLKRFQCVCKHWNTLIKTPSFIQHHLHHSTHQNQNSSLVVGPQFSERSFSLLSCDQNKQFHDLHIPPFLRSLKRLAVEASCNGLLFLVHWGRHHAYPLLWNPATREVTKIHLSCFDFSDTESDSDSDVDMSWHVTFGFGFSPVINDYKIVRIHEIYNENYDVEVFSLSEGSWRRIKFDNIKGVSVFGQSVTVNGVIFWRGSKHVGVGEYMCVIVAFDMVTEVFTVIPLPPITTDSHELAVYDGKLAVFCYDKRKDSQSFPLYFRVMEEGGVWGSSEKYLGNFGFKLFPGPIWGNQIVSVDPEMENGRHLCLIDVGTNECKRVDIPEFKSRFGYGVSVFNYVESLVPVGRVERPRRPRFILVEIYP